MEMCLYVFHKTERLDNPILSEFDTRIIGVVAHDAMAALDMVNNPYSRSIGISDIDTWLIVANDSEAGIRFDYHNYHE